MDDATESAGGSGGATRSTTPVDVAIAIAGAGAWVWLVKPLVSEPSELWLPAAAVPPIALATIVAERRRAGGGVAVLAASLAIGVGALAIGTGTSPLTLVAFALGLLKPAGWPGEHLLLRAVPLTLLVAYPLRRSWGTAVLSAFGATAFLAIAAAMARVAA